MNKSVRMYALVTQGLIQTIVLMYLGYKLGADWWLDSTFYGGLFALLGIIIGLVYTIYSIIKVGEKFDK